MTPKRGLRILHLEDDAADAALIERALTDEGIVAQLQRVWTRDAYLSAISEGPFDLILSDNSLPGFDGLTALALLRERDLETPFVLVSGTVGEERAAESLKSGATDFVLKDRIKRLGAAVRRALAEVEDRRQRRSLEMQLQQAQKLEAVGRLTGSVAHDFNNLLSVILSTTEVLLADLPAADPRRNDIEAIGEAAERGAALTRQLLAFSRRQDLKPRVLDLNALLRSLEPLLRRLLKRDVRLELQLDAGLAPVKADPGQLEQVVVNLCVNARDAMPQGGSVTIATTNTAVDTGVRAGGPSVEPGKYVCLSVTDTGTGMDEETMTRIFDPFFTTKPEGMGTGLGLATVYGIVKQSGGNVWVTSKPGVGTTFEIYLPPHDETRAPAP
jgi:signal transduction histidine kinase